MRGLDGWDDDDDAEDRLQVDESCDSFEETLRSRVTDQHPARRNPEQEKQVDKSYDSFKVESSARRDLRGSDGVSDAPGMSMLESHRLRVTDQHLASGDPEQKKQVEVTTIVEQVSTEQKTQMESAFERSFADSASGQEMHADKPSFDSLDIDEQINDIFARSEVDLGHLKQGQSINDNFERPGIADFDQDGVKQVDAATVPQRLIVNVQASKQKTLDINDEPSEQSQDQDPYLCDEPKTARDRDSIVRERQDIDDQTSEQKRQLQNPSFCGDQATSQKMQINKGLLVEDQESERKTDDIDDQISEQNRQVENPSLCDELAVRDRGAMEERQVDAATVLKRSMVDIQPRKQKALDINDEPSEQTRQVQNPYLCDEPKTVMDQGGIMQEREDIDDQTSEQTRQVQNPYLCEEPKMVRDRGGIVQARQDIGDQTREQKKQLQNPSVCDDQAASQNTQLNILLLGETGVGKSTMINAFANYITFQSMEDVASSSQDMIALVPMAFTHVDQNYQAHEIKFGEPDPNEQHMTSGESVTQSCRSYTFPLSENQIVHLIDTPGIGDTRGVEQDRANFSQMLAYLANYNEIHGICIMLKPNNSRLNITFSLCINELLRNLHKSASANIVFLFTYSRGSFYTPGDTVVPLKALLKQVLDVPPNVAIPFNESTVYCVDNEAVRLVVASKKGFSFSEKDRTSFSESWNRSTEECKRMLMHFKSIKPHKMMETVSLNTAASVVMKLQQPLASVISTIHENLELFEMKKKELEEFKGNLAELEMEEVVLQTKEFVGGPATVCTSCVTVMTESGWRKTQYKVCHQSCTSASHAISGERASRFCNVFNFFGKCHVCQCSFRHHMRVSYVTEFVRRKKGIRSAVPEKVDAQEAGMQLMRRSQEWQEELNAISKAAACLTVFLKSNSIATYSDDMQAYVKHQINMETEVRVAFVKRLQAFLERYEQDMQEVGKEISAAEAVKIAKSLYKQRHTGPKLQELVEKVTTIEHCTAQLYVKTCPRPPPSRFNWLLQHFR